MHSRSQFRSICIGAVIGLGLASSMCTHGQTIHGGTQVALIARMPDSFTVRWVDGSGGALEAGMSLTNGLRFKLAGRLLPGANVIVECSSSSGRIEERQVSIHSLGYLRDRGGSLACGGLGRAAASETVNVLSKHPAEDAGGMADDKVDLILSVI